MALTFLLRVVSVVAALVLGLAVPALALLLVLAVDRIGIGVLAAIAAVAAATAVGGFVLRTRAARPS